MTNQPLDLDSTIILPTETVNYANKISSDGVVSLDLDMQNGFGPETMTFLHLPSGANVWRYLVNNYSGSPAISTSGAVVTIYSSSGTQTITCPTSGTGTWWHVVNLTSAGLVTKNSIRTDSNPY